MLPTDLEKYLHEHIPLSKAMAVSVVSMDRETVVLRAPLAPNINHRETVFGGSAASLAILAAWSLLHTRLGGEGIDEFRLVIQRDTMEYKKPILGEFTARAMLASGQDWSKFTHMLLRKGRARIAVTAVLEYNGQEVGRLTGEFVALNKTFA